MLSQCSTESVESCLVEILGLRETREGDLCESSAHELGISDLAGLQGERSGTDTVQSNLRAPLNVDDMPDRCQCDGLDRAPLGGYSQVEV